MLGSVVFAQERGFLHQRKIRRKDFPIREYTVLETFPMVSMVYLAVTGKVFDEMSWYDQARHGEAWSGMRYSEEYRRKRKRTEHICLIVRSRSGTGGYGRGGMFLQYWKWRGGDQISWTM